MKRKIKVAVVGIGLMGRQHLIAIKNSKKADLHSIVDINERSRAHAKKFNVPFYKNSSALIKNNKPDAVIVATPNQFHEKHTISFLNAKIPVLLEKPISSNIQKAKKMGFGGKACIHPDQIDISNKIFSWGKKLK